MKWKKLPTLINTLDVAAFILERLLGSESESLKTGQSVYQKGVIETADCSGRTNKYNQNNHNNNNKTLSLTRFEKRSPLRYLGANKIEATSGNANGQ